MTRLEEIIANALAGIPETDTAILAREVVRLRAQSVAMFRAGTRLANCAHNLSQYDALRPDLRFSLGEGYKEWDLSIQGFRANQEES